MTGESGASAPPLAKGDRRLAILLAMAMFVLVVDTSVMNVSIASVVHDLHTTVSGVQSAIALEALVSAAFILIGSKVGDLIGRKRAYVLGLLGYGIGALAMALAQGLTAIIVFWAIVGGIGASLLLPAMQSLIHGNFADTPATPVHLRPLRRRMAVILGPDSAPNARRSGVGRTRTLGGEMTSQGTSAQVRACCRWCKRPPAPQVTAAAR
jgi:MFS family permease